MLRILPEFVYSRNLCSNWKVAIKIFHEFKKILTLPPSRLN